MTCLLGHNGAGKSTTIGMLTGLFPPTEGDVYVWGRSLRSMPEIRQRMGICPQHSVLYPDLSVRAHLSLVAALKGLRRPRRAIEEMLVEVGLTEKRNVRSKNLSGGMKRKLSVAMALLGDPLFVLLDEPTSGMDPYSRRATWELIRRNKAGRCVLLTTHYLDEADVLGDRIAVLSRGRPQCVGSALFLKRRFGIGYSLTISTKVGDRAAADGAERLLRTLFGAEPFEKHGAELVFRLPMAANGRFGDLLDALDAWKARGQVSAYGLSVTTLEEVFLRLAQLDAAAEPQAPEPPALLEDPPPGKMEPQERAPQAARFGPEPPGAAGAKVLAVGGAEEGEEGEDEPVNLGVRGAEPRGFADQLAVLIEKRYHVAKRDLSGCFFQVLLPVLLVAFALLILTIEPLLAGPSLSLTASMFDDPTVVQMSVGGNASSPVEANVRADADVFLNGSRYGVSLPADTAYRLVSERNGTRPRTSYELSEHMLDTYNSFREERFGAYAFRDTIDMNVTVDWPLVADNLDEVLQFSIFLAASLGLQDAGFGLDANLTGLVLDALPEGVGGDAAAALEGLLGDAALEELLADNNVTSGAIDDFLDENNVTLPDALSDLIANLTDNTTGNVDAGAVDVADLQAGGLDADPSFDSITLNVTGPGGGLDFSNPTITVNGLVLNVTVGNATFEVAVGDLEVSLDVKALLPEESETYRLAVNSAETIMHNSTASHAMPAFYGDLSSTRYQQCYFADAQAEAEAEDAGGGGGGGGGGEGSAFNFGSFGESFRRFSASVHPLPLTAQQSIEIQTILSLFASLFLLVPLCYVPANAAIFVVRERVCKAKHLQLVSGVEPAAYWVATYLWDALLFLLIAAGCVFVIFLYGEDSARVFWEFNDARSAVFLAIYSYGLGCVPLNYLYSRLFNNHSTAQISIMAINFVTGFVAVLAIRILVSLEDTRELGEQLVHIFRAFPPFNVGEALINLSIHYYSRTIFGERSSALSWEVTGRSITFCLLEAAGYFAILLSLESESLARAANAAAARHVRLTEFVNGDGAAAAAPPPEDEDVAAEAERVDGLSPQGAAVRVSRLRKTYASNPLATVLCALLRLFGARRRVVVKRAVRGISFAVRAGECFGLLGINGAGKSTTLAVLTGDVALSSGSCSIGGFDVAELRACRKLIGFCPQVDPLLQLMTGRETLRFFGKIKGLDGRSLEAVVQSTLRFLGLKMYADMPCGRYSGGNKRKLSLGIALIGDPKVLFLDEPSSGMDPAARRRCWDTLEEVAKKRSLILTTHSMEEAEALCHRLTIMVSGRAQCIGTPQQLKSRFGKDYQLSVKVSFGAAGAFLEFFRGAFPAARLLEHHGEHFKFSLPVRGTSLSALFRTIEENKERLGVLDYAAGQATLEQIFLNMAKRQDEETAHLAGVEYDDVGAAAPVEEVKQGR